ncbi:hypothetical protein QE152_g22626 [Popillia japonica]|uniref:Uncharacterized protein n=1 Tax=Popillia japonica TaxID=7064 RepID=A0AAW1KK73_POPJA
MASNQEELIETPIRMDWREMASNQEELIETPIRMDWREPPVEFSSEESIMQSGEGITRSVSNGSVDERGQGNQLNLILNMVREEA